MLVEYRSLRSTCDVIICYWLLTGSTCTSRRSAHMNRSMAIRGMWLISAAMMVAAATIVGTATAGAAPQPTGPTVKPFTLAPSMGMDKLDPQTIARSNRQQLLDKIAGQITDGLSESA